MFCARHVVKVGLSFWSDGWAVGSWGGVVGSTWNVAALKTEKAL